MMCERCVRRESILDCQAVLDPGQAAFILLMRCHAEKMERPRGHCKLIPPSVGQHKQPQIQPGACMDCQLTTILSKFIFRDVWPKGSSQVCFGSEALPFCGLQHLLMESFGPLKLLMELSVNADDPLLFLVFSSTLRRWLEVKQTLVSSFWTSKSEVERSKIFHYFILPLGLASLLLSSAQHCPWFSMFPSSPLNLIWGGIKV